MIRSHRRTLHSTLVALALGLLANAVPSRGQVASRTLRVTDSGIDERISLELEEADVVKVLTSFAQILQVEPEIDPAVEGKVTIEIHNVRTRTALSAVCESVWCLWRVEGGRLKVTRDPAAPEETAAAPGRAEGPDAVKLDELIDMSLKDADLRQVLGAFAAVAGVEVQIDDDVSGRVTVELKDTPVHQALDAVCRMQSCFWELVEGEDGAVLHFSSR